MQTTTKFDRYAQKILKCIRSCNTLSQLHVCAIMYNRLMKTADTKYSQVTNFVKTMVSLQQELDQKQSHIIRTVPNAVELSQLSKYENNVKI